MVLCWKETSADMRPRYIKNYSSYQYICYIDVLVYNVSSFENMTGLVAFQTPLGKSINSKPLKIKVINLFLKSVIRS